MLVDILIKFIRSAGNNDVTMSLTEPVSYN